MTAAASLDAPVMRRSPIQRRSTQRVERMLDVCAALLHEVGYEELTTKAIAEHAGISIGSVYQYFPHKKSIVRALALRFLEEFQQRLAAALAGRAPAGWEELVGVIVAVHGAMIEESPGFRALRTGPAHDPYILQPDADNQTVLAAMVRGLYDGRVPAAGEVDRHLVVALTTGDALLQLAYRRHPDGDADTLADLGPLVVRYLDEKVPLAA